MIEYAIIFGAGLSGALLLGMIGVGTALLCVPTLIFVLPALGVAEEHIVHTALGTTMFAAALQSVASVITHHRRGNVYWPVLKKTLPTAIIGVIIGVVYTSSLPGDLLRIIFAVFILISAGRMFFKKSKADDTDVDEVNKSTATLALGSGAIGFFASFIGAGGGVFAVPFLHWCGLVMRRCVGTSNANGLPISLAGALTYGLTGHAAIGYSATHIGYINLPVLGVLAISGFIAAPIGARLAHAVSPNIIKSIFATLVTVIAIKMLIGA